MKKKKKKQMGWSGWKGDIISDDVLINQMHGLTFVEGNFKRLYRKCQTLIWASFTTVAEVKMKELREEGGVNLNLINDVNRRARRNNELQINPKLIFGNA